MRSKEFGVPLPEIAGAIRRNPTVRAATPAHALFTSGAIREASVATAP